MRRFFFCDKILLIHHQQGTEIVKVKVEHVNPFIKATMETYKSMLGVDLTLGKVKLKGDTKVSHDISGIIGLSGDAKGAVALSYPQNVAFDSVGKFIGEEVKEMSADVTDAIGELANIIAEEKKKDLVDFKISISLPTVVTGKGILFTRQKMFYP